MLSVAFVTACGDGASAPGKGERPLSLYIGSLDGTDAQVAVVKNDERWAAYACGGPSTLDVVTTWFQGSLDAHHASLSAASVDGQRFEMMLSEDTATGTVTTNDESVPFLAGRVHGHAVAGLFQLVEKGCRTGLIIPPSGDGSPQGVYCADLDVREGYALRIYEQVTPILPITSAEAVRGRVVIDTKARIITLRPVVLPLDPT